MFLIYKYINSFSLLLAAGAGEERTIDDLYNLLNNIYILLFAIALMVCFMLLIKFISSFLGGG